MIEPEARELRKQTTAQSKQGERDGSGDARQMGELDALCEQNRAPTQQTPTQQRETTGTAAETHGDQAAT